MMYQKIYLCKKKYLTIQKLELIIIHQQRKGMETYYLSFSHYKQADERAKIQSFRKITIPYSSSQLPGEVFIDIDESTRVKKRKKEKEDEKEESVSITRRFFDKQAALCVKFRSNFGHNNYDCHLVKSMAEVLAYCTRAIRSFGLLRSKVTVQSERNPGGGQSRLSSALRRSRLYTLNVGSRMQ